MVRPTPAEAAAVARAQREAAFGGSGLTSAGERAATEAAAVSAAKAAISAGGTRAQASAASKIAVAEARGQTVTYFTLPGREDDVFFSIGKAKLPPGAVRITPEAGRVTVSPSEYEYLYAEEQAGRAGQLAKRLGYTTSPTARGGIWAARAGEEFVIEPGIEAVTGGRITGITTRAEFVPQLGTGKMVEPQLPFRVESARKIFKKLGYDIEKAGSGIIARKGIEEVRVTPTYDIATAGRITPMTIREKQIPQLGTGEMKTGIGNLWQRMKQQSESINLQMSRKLEGLTPTIRKAGRARGGKIPVVQLMKPPKWQKALKEKTLGLGKDYLKGFRDKPLKTALWTGTFVALPSALKLGKLGLAKAGIKIWKPVAAGYKYGLPAAYGLSVYARREKFGEIAATEITPMLLGGYVGMKIPGAVARRTARLEIETLPVRTGYMVGETFRGTSRLAKPAGVKYYHQLLGKKFFLRKGTGDVVADIWQKGSTYRVKAKTMLDIDGKNIVGEFIDAGRAGGQLGRGIVTGKLTEGKIVQEMLALKGFKVGLKKKPPSYTIDALMETKLIGKQVPRLVAPFAKRWGYYMKMPSKDLIGQWEAGGMMEWATGKKMVTGIKTNIPRQLTMRIGYTPGKPIRFKYPRTKYVSFPRGESKAEFTEPMFSGDIPRIYLWKGYRRGGKLTRAGKESLWHERTHYEQWASKLITTEAGQYLPRERFLLKGMEKELAKSLPKKYMYKAWGKKYFTEKGKFKKQSLMEEREAEVGQLRSSYGKEFETRLKKGLPRTSTIWELTRREPGQYKFDITPKIKAPEIEFIEEPVIGYHSRGVAIQAKALKGLGLKKFRYETMGGKPPQGYIFTAGGMLKKMGKRGGLRLQTPLKLFKETTKFPEIKGRSWVIPTEKLYLGLSKEMLIPRFKPMLGIAPVSVEREELKPTIKPSLKPKLKPSLKPSLKPMLKPEIKPTIKPTLKPKLKPKVVPTLKPALKPSLKPMLLPKLKPTTIPFLKVPPPPPPPPFKFDWKPGRARKAKQIRKFKLKTKYKPSLVAVDKMLYGKKPKILTGLYVRPIIK